MKVISIPHSEDEYYEYADNGYDERSITAIFKSQMETIVSEFKLMAQFKGTSHIVSYEDHMIVPHEDGRGWDILIRMELLTSLPEYINRHGLTEGQIVQMGSDICQALELCGQKGIIHRDIKPQNIFVNEFGDFKLGDFGIAKSMDHTTKATKTGTYSYMAPEVYSGRPYGASVDLYSLGLVLYWALNERRLPFLVLPPAIPTAAQLSEAQAKRLGGAAIPRPLHGSGTLKAAVLTACSFDSAGRFANPGAFRQALQQCGRPTEPIIPPSQGQSGGRNTSGPSASAKDYTTGEWSMKFTPTSKGERTVGANTELGATWGAIPETESGPSDEPLDRTEPVAPPSDKPTAGKSSPEIEKKRRRSIRLWAVWMFFWIGAGINVDPTGRFPKNFKYIALPVCAAVAVIPFARAVMRALKESNRSPRVLKTLRNSLIVVVVLLALSLYGNMANDQPKNDLDSRSESSSEIDVPYTKGTFDGVVYRNEWADLSFSLPYGFENASEEYYALFEDEDSAECGLFLISDSGERITVAFEELPSEQITEKMCLDSLVRVMNRTILDQGASAEIDDTPFREVMIGSKSYLAGGVNFSMGDITGAATAYVRRIHDRMCAIQIVGESAEANDALAQSLDTVDTGEPVSPFEAGGPDESRPVYTKGTLADGVYTNEWADLKLVIPEGFQNVSEETYLELSKSGDSECGLFLVKDNGQYCVVMFFAPSISLVSPKDCLEESMNTRIAEFSEREISAQWDGQSHDVQIAENTYASSALNVNDGFAFESLYLRQIGNRWCSIEIFGFSVEENDALAAQFVPYNS